MTNGAGRRLLAVVSGLLLAASFPNVALWPSAWIGLAPYLYAIRSARPRSAFGLGMIAGLAFYLPTLYWVAPTISNFTTIPGALALGALLAMCLGVSLFIAAFGVALEWFASGGLPRVLLAPPIWVALEWTRTFFPIAFPWASLGYSQQGSLTMIQAADLGGVYFVSAILVATSVCLAEAVRAQARQRRLLVVTAVSLPLAVAGYGALRLPVVDAAATGQVLRVGVVQGNIAQDVKWDARFQDETFEKYLRLTGEIGPDTADVIVWPEASAPFYVPQDIRTKGLERSARLLDTDLVVGAPAFERERGRPTVNYNRAFHITPDGGVSGSYDKIQLVPFGEYVPFGFLLSWIGKIVEIVGDFGWGEEFSVFDTRTLEGGEARFSILICYEGIFPGLTRRFVVEGADVLFNISNDAWYGDTSAPYQLLSMAAVRAVENRTPVVRSTNTGVSAAIDRSGRISNTTPLFEDATFVAPVDIGATGSLYARFGNWFVYTCLVLVAGSLFRWRRPIRAAER